MIADHQLQFYLGDYMFCFSFHWHLMQMPVSDDISGHALIVWNRLFTVFWSQPR